MKHKHLPDIINGRIAYLVSKNSFTRKLNNLRTPQSHSSISRREYLLYRTPTKGCFRIPAAMICYSQSINKIHFFPLYKVKLDEHQSLRQTYTIGFGGCGQAFPK